MNINQMNLREFEFTAQQKQKALFYLSFWHILIIASSNYLVQIPFTIFNFHTTWGAFSFPFIFLTTDLTVRIFGAKMARKIVLLAMIPALIISYLISIFFQDGVFNNAEKLNSLNIMVLRIAGASFLAYLTGQLLDIAVFNKLRNKFAWWLAPAASTILGNLLDTIIFFSIAFYKSDDEFMAENWVQIAQVDYAWKLIICTLFFLPAYGVLLKILTEKLTKK